MSDGRPGAWKAALPILGVVLGAYLSFLYGQETSRRKMLEDQRAAAYVQYVEASALQKMLDAAGDEVGALEQRGLMNAARFRMAIYGSKAVLEGVAQAQRLEVRSPEWKEDTAQWFQAMRNEIVSAKERVGDEVIRVLLWPDDYRP